jgi:hypothetical protein
MNDNGKTKEQLVTDLLQLQQKIDSLHAAAKVRTAELKSSLKKVLITCILNTYFFELINRFQ